jgi:hypothetical protein
MSKRFMLAAAVALATGIAVAGSVVKVEDHSIPKSKVRTYHVTCTGSRLAMVRIDPTVNPPTLCGLVQDGSKPESCRPLADPARSDALVQQMATALCS